VYGHLEGDDTTYQDFLKSVNNELDLGIDDHRDKLLVWLRKWGCRQFWVAKNDISSKEILDWYKKNSKVLSCLKSDLYHLNEGEIQLLGDLYSSLKQKTASINKKGNIISVGPTGAAKILFALKPETTLPWDNPIREHFKYDDSKESYIKYIEKAKDILFEIEKDCIKYNVQFNNLPEHLERPNSTHAKLIDEYFWITITMKCYPPPRDLLAKWYNWSIIK